MAPDERALWVVATDVGARKASLVRVDLVARTVEVLVPAGAVDVALDPGGTRLAYSWYRNPATNDASRGPSITVVDLASGRTMRVDGPDESVLAAMMLDWSPGGHHLAFQWGYEGLVPKVLDVDAPPASLDAAPVPESPGGSGFMPMCWSSPSELAVGWPGVPLEAPVPAGHVTDVDVNGSGAHDRPSTVHVDTLACRPSDGAVGTVDVIGRELTGRRGGDLVVVRRDGTTTVLGHHYVAVHTL